METNEAYLELINDVVHKGELVNCRGYDTVELLNQCISIDMKKPLINLTTRKLGYKFACAEAAWVISGDNRVISLEPYSKIIKNFSDDGVFFFGAYGPKVIDQLEYIGRCFKNDLYTRQAVINIWREKPPVSKDIPCTLNLQFIIRNNELHIITNMRSSDLWLGVPYDLFTFSMIGSYVALYLKQLLKINIQLGTLFLNAVSRHYYKDAFGYTEEHVLELLNEKEHQIDFNYKPLNLDEFDSPLFLKMHLQYLAEEKKGFEDIYFLKELENWWSEK